MILFYILGSVALLLNLAGRILILRRDTQLSDGWHRAIKFLPGAELLYLIFRWERARAGCVICGISIAMSVPVAHHFLAGTAAGKFASLLAPISMTSGQTSASARANDPATLRKLAEHKERKLAAVNQFLTQWYQNLTARQEYLCDEMPEETLEYNRMAAAYQGLMRVWKDERKEADTLKARL